MYVQNYAVIFLYIQKNTGITLCTQKRPSVECSLLQSHVASLTTLLSWWYRIDVKMIDSCVKPECEDWVMGNTTLKMDVSFCVHKFLPVSFCVHKILQGIFCIYKKIPARFCVKKFIQKITGIFLYIQKIPCKILYIQKITCKILYIQKNTGKILCVQNIPYKSSR